MDKKSNISTITGIMAATAMACTIMTGCEYKDLHEGCEMNTITVDFDWEEVDSIPESMRVAFYPADDLANANLTKGYTFFDLPRRIWPAKIDLPVGIYNVTAWNNDTEHVTATGYGSQQTLHATTAPYTSRGTFDTPGVLDSIYGGQGVLDYPDYMVHANEVDFEVMLGRKDQQLTLQTDSMVVAVEYRVHGIGGLAWVRQAKGALNNIAGKRFMAYGNSTEDKVAVMFDCRYNAADSLVYGDMYVFGINPTDMRKLSHKLVLFFWMDGGKVYLPIDVTSIMAQYDEDQHRIVIDVPSLGIDLRECISSRNTFDVDLDEWEDVSIDIGF